MHNQCYMNVFRINHRNYKQMLLGCTQKMWTLASLVFFINTSNAQYTKGITGKADTGYSTYSAYLNTIKTHPDIKIVPEFKSPAVSEKRGIVYCAQGKRQLKLDAFYPKAINQQNKIAIVIIHGGGWRTGNRGQHYPLAQKLASLGYTCFTPEYRLSTEALFPAAVYDIKAAIRWVKINSATYHLDTSKIVVLGFSAGGEMAAFMGTTGNMPLFEGTTCNTGIGSHVNAVVDIDGTLSFVHPEGGEGDDSKNISAATYWFGYSKKDKPELWEAASPLSYVDGKTPPTLFINSSVARMHAGRGDYIKVLNENNVYSEVKNFENAPHSFCLFEPWFEPTVQYIDAFLKKVFKHS